jgi:hypothetical protein
MTHLAESIAGALLSMPPAPLEHVPDSRFRGTGIYVIYYVGPFRAYQLIVKANVDGAWRQPIYVGKAVPRGSRRGIDVARATDELWQRLLEHRESVDQVTNLSIGDFWVRWLVVEPIWTPLGESLLINRYAPIWNTILSGFGNHDPGSGRYNQRISRWDMLHPGRPWAPRLRPRAETAENIEADAEEYLRARLPQ